MPEKRDSGLFLLGLAAGVAGAAYYLKTKQAPAKVTSAIQEQEQLAINWQNMPPVPPATLLQQPVLAGPVTVAVPLTVSLDLGGELEIVALPPPAPLPAPEPSTAQEIILPQSYVDSINQINSKLSGIRSANRIIDSGKLNDILQAASRQGDTQYLTNSFTLETPTMTTDVLSMGIPNGFVCVEMQPIEITSDIYDPDITVNVYIDGFNLYTPGLPGGLTLTGPVTVYVGDHFVKRNAVIIELINNSAFDAIFTIKIKTAMISSYIYEDWYSRIIDGSLNALSEIAMLNGGIKI